MKFVEYMMYFSYCFKLEITNFLIDKSPSLCYNDLAFGRIFLCIG